MQVFAGFASPRGARRHRDRDGLSDTARRHWRRCAPGVRAGTVGIYRLWRDLGKGKVFEAVKRSVAAFNFSLDSQTGLRL
jgi:hypothetical protein